MKTKSFESSGKKIPSHHLKDLAAKKNPKAGGNMRCNVKGESDDKKSRQASSQGIQTNHNETLLCVAGP